MEQNLSPFCWPSNGFQGFCSNIRPQYNNVCSEVCSNGLCWPGSNQSAACGCDSQQVPRMKAYWPGISQGFSQQARNNVDQKLAKLGQQRPKKPVPAIQSDETKRNYAEKQVRLLTDALSKDVIEEEAKQRKGEDRKSKSLKKPTQKKGNKPASKMGTSSKKPVQNGRPTTVSAGIGVFDKVAQMRAPDTKTSGKKGTASPYKSKLGKATTKPKTASAKSQSATVIYYDTRGAKPESSMGLDGREVASSDALGTEMKDKTKKGLSKKKKTGEGAMEKEFENKPTTTTGIEESTEKESLETNKGDSVPEEKANKAPILSASKAVELSMKEPKSIDEQIEKLTTLHELHSDMQNKLAGPSSKAGPSKIPTPAATKKSALKSVTSKNPPPSKPADVDTINKQIKRLSSLHKLHSEILDKLQGPDSKGKVMPPALKNKTSASTADTSKSAGPLNADTSKSTKPIQAETSQTARQSKVDASKTAKPSKANTVKTVGPSKIDTSKSLQPSEADKLKATGPVDSSKSSRPSKADTTKNAVPSKVDTSKSLKPLKADIVKTTGPSKVDASRATQSSKLNSSKSAGISKPDTSQKSNASKAEVPNAADTSKQVQPSTSDTSKVISQPSKADTSKQMTTSPSKVNTSTPSKVDAMLPSKIDSSQQAKSSQTDSSLQTHPPSKVHTSTQVQPSKTATSKVDTQPRPSKLDTSKPSKGESAPSKDNTSTQPHPSQTGRAMKDIDRPKDASSKHENSKPETHENTTLKPVASESTASKPEDVKSNASKNEKPDSTKSKPNTGESTTFKPGTSKEGAISKSDTSSKSKPDARESTPSKPNDIKSTTSKPGTSGESASSKTNPSTSTTLKPDTSPSKSNQTEPSSKPNISKESTPTALSQQSPSSKQIQLKDSKTSNKTPSKLDTAKSAQPSESVTANPSGVVRKVESESQTLLAEPSDLVDKVLEEQRFDLQLELDLIGKGDEGQLDESVISESNISRLASTIARKCLCEQYRNEVKTQAELDELELDQQSQMLVQSVLSTTDGLTVGVGDQAGPNEPQSPRQATQDRDSKTRKDQASFMSQIASIGLGLPASLGRPVATTESTPIISRTITAEQVTAASASAAVFPIPVENSSSSGVLDRIATVGLGATATHGHSNRSGLGESRRNSRGTSQGSPKTSSTLSSKVASSTAIGSHGSMMTLMLAPQSVPESNLDVRVPKEDFIKAHAHQVDSEMSSAGGFGVHINPAQQNIQTLGQQPVTPSTAVLDQALMGSSSKVPTQSVQTLWKSGQPPPEEQTPQTSTGAQQSSTQARKSVSKRDKESMLNQLSSVRQEIESMKTDLEQATQSRLSRSGSSNH